MNLYKEQAPEKELMIREIIKYSRFYDQEDLAELRCRSLKSIDFIYRTCVAPFINYGKLN